jgi:hypothetical protein
MATAGFAELFVRSTLIVRGDAARMAGNVGSSPPRGFLGPPHQAP